MNTIKITVEEEGFYGLWHKAAFPGCIEDVQGGAEISGGVQTEPGGRLIVRDNTSTNKVFLWIANHIEMPLP